MDDLYNFSNPSNLLNSNIDLENSQSFQRAASQTAAGRRPPTLTSHGRRQSTAAYYNKTPPGNNDARPMTSVKAAGFKRYSNSVTSGSNFDPLSDKLTYQNPITQSATKEKAFTEREKEVQDLIEKSIEAAHNKDYSRAIDIAQEAGKRERAVIRDRETHDMTQSSSLDLTFSVCLNIGLQYENNELYSEALNAYKALTQNRSFENVGRIKVNMGNIYFKQKDYSQAIKYYQMALDQITGKYKMLRIKIMNNIGIAFLKLQRYDEAIQAFEYIMNEKPDYQAGFQLICTYFAINDVEKMKSTFKRILDVNLGVDLDDHRYHLQKDTPAERAYQDAIKNDSLKEQELLRIQTARHYITASAKLIAPKIFIDSSGEAFGKGFDWCVEEVKASRSLQQLSNELEVEKALALMRAGMVSEAEKLLKAFEKREDGVVKAQASNNLSFMYYQQGNIALASKFADLAIEIDKYSPASLVNRGNCFYEQKQLEEACQCYLQAMQIDSTCIEAMYNFAFCQFEIGNLEVAENQLHKLNAILPGQACVLYLLALVYKEVGDQGQMTHWLLQLAGVVPSDAGVLQSLGKALAEEGDQSQAFSYHYESYKLFPGDLNAIEWLSHYYLESQFPEKALNYFERAILIEPANIKWHLCAVMCMNRCGNYNKAYESLKRVHIQFPDSIECLTRLVQKANEMKQPEEAREYEKKLKRAEKQQQAIEQNRVNSGRIRSGGHRSGQGSGKARQLSAKNRASPPVLSTEQTLPPSGNNKRSENIVDPSYSDPVGPSISMRPRTAKNKNMALAAMQDDIHDFEADDFLPD